MSLFRKKPVVIEARRLPADVCSVADKDELLSIRSWSNARLPGDGGLLIPTLEGEMRAGPGDWIIKGVAGEFYPCKPEIFAATYEAMSARPLSERVQIDDAKNLLIVDGLRFAAELFDGLSIVTPPGRLLRVISVDGGVVTIQAFDGDDVVAVIARGAR